MKINLLKLKTIYIVIIFIILEVLLLLFLSYYKTIKIEETQTKSVKKLEIQLDSVLNFYSTTSSILIDEIINNKNISKFLKDINSKDKAIQSNARVKLFEILNPTYQRLSKHGFRQLHFHDKEGNSFLRFHAPENYGDNLFNIRATILEANKSKQAQFGFEEGKIFNGFRNVFPIIIDGEFYGTVELSNGFEAFSQTLHKIYPFEFKLIISKEYVDLKVFPSLVRKNYINALISSSFYEENNSEKMLKKEHISQEIIDKLDKKLFSKIDKELLSYKAFIKPVDLDGKHYVLTFLPIEDYNKTNNTYIIQYIQDKSIQEIQNSYYLSIIFSNLVILLGIVFYFMRHYLFEKNIFMKKAFTDPLTNLFSRAKFNDDIERIIVNQDLNKYSIIMFDIDHFKYVNDSFGHDVGDIVLQEVAQVSKKTLRESDLIYRWGGEEFLILVKNKNSNHLYNLGEKLRVAIASYQFTKIEHLTCSYGIAISKDNDTKDTLLKRADEYLYLAKQSGRNCVIVDDE